MKIPVTTQMKYPIGDGLWAVFDGEYVRIFNPEDTKECEIKLLRGQCDALQVFALEIVEAMRPYEFPKDIEDDDREPRRIRTMESGELFRLRELAETCGMYCNQLPREVRDALHALPEIEKAHQCDLSKTLQS